MGFSSRLSRPNRCHENEKGLAQGLAQELVCEHTRISPVKQRMEFKGRVLKARRGVST